MISSRRVALTAVMLVLPLDLVSQAIPRNEFRDWARAHAHPLQRTGTGVSAPDLRPLRAIVGNARILALAEPMHIAQEVLAMRNRMIQYAVTALGVRAVALETGLANSRRLYDHVIGRTIEADSVLASSFSYGFGDFPENLELIRWLTTYNAATDSTRTVRLYGIDLTGQMASSAAPALFAVFDYLDGVDPQQATAVRAEFADVTGDLTAQRYTQLERSAQNASTAMVQDLIGLLMRRRPTYIAASSRDAFDWALQSAINTAQDLAYFRVLPRNLFEQMAQGGLEAIEPSQQLRDMQAMRDVAMLENLSWITEREAARGRIFVYAHMGHLQKHVHRSNHVKQVDGMVPLGVYAHSKFGADFVVVGTYFGAGEGYAERFRPAPPNPDGIDGLLASVDLPTFVMDLRRIPPSGPLFEWFARGHATRTGNFGEWIELIQPARAFDAILYLDRVTPVAPLRQVPE